MKVVGLNESKNTHKRKHALTANPLSSRATIRPYHTKSLIQLSAVGEHNQIKRGALIDSSLLFIAFERAESNRPIQVLPQMQRSYQSAIRLEALALRALLERLEATVCWRSHRIGGTQLTLEHWYIAWRTQQWSAIIEQRTNSMTFKRPLPNHNHRWCSVQFSAKVHHRTIDSSLRMETNISIIQRLFRVLERPYSQNV